MSTRLSAGQLRVLGLLALVIAGLGIAGLVRLGQSQNLWQASAEYQVLFSDAQDLTPGTPVTMLGIPVGQVRSIELQQTDPPQVLVTISLAQEHAQRLRADATAEIHTTGMLGAKTVVLLPGRTSAGPLQHATIPGKTSLEMTQVMEKLNRTADQFGKTAEEAQALLREARSGSGTLARLLQDDSLYQDLSGLAKDTRIMMKRADSAVGVFEQKASDVDKFVQDGRQTLKSVKQGTDAVQKLPLLRSYVEDAAAILTRPECKRDSVVYIEDSLFTPETAILTEAGKKHLDEVAAWLRGVREDKAELVIVALHDPESTYQTPASALELTRKQAELAGDYLKNSGALKTGWFSKRKLTTLGLGQGPSPLVTRQPMPKSYLEIHLLTPQ